MKRISPWYLLVLALMFPATWWLQYRLERADFHGGTDHSYLPFLLLFGSLFALYGFAVLRGNDKLHRNIGIGTGLLLRICIVFAVPTFSDDFYRFIWDGHVGLAGYNPFHQTPREWITEMGANTPEHLQLLFQKLNSKDYHTVYPPVLQGAFAAAAWLGKSTYGTMVVLKLFIVLAEALSIWFLQRIINRFQLPHRSILVYALNPVVIFELTGNLHFEAFMICFTLGALWMLMLSRPLSTALFLAFAIASKLLPVLAFPFMVRRLGWGRSLLIAGLTAVIVFGLFAIYFDAEALANFRESLSLYFNRFEFNGGFFGLGKWLHGSQYFWLQRLLPWAVMAVILFSAWRERDRIWKGYAAALMLALALYQFASPVVHPWYITPIVALCVLGPYRFPVIWSLFLPLTYLSYTTDTAHPVVEQNWILWLEYGSLAIFTAYEAVFVRRRRTLEEWMRNVPALRKWLQATIPARLKIKLHRIEPLLPPSRPILDLGTGNGGLCKALREHGFVVQPCDIKDISFFPEVKPVLYDGQRLPFADGHFDTVMLITVLHHTPNPDAVLDEAIRVSGRRLVVMEDIYKNPIQKYLTYFTDSLVNMEFVGHPHTNRSDRRWKATFAAKGLKVVSKSEFRTLLFFRQVIYVLERS